ncbi:hypothetical protein [Vibrio brasiliensis]
MAYSVQTLVVKTGSAISAFVIGFILTAIDNVPNTAQAADTIQVIQIIIIDLPALFFCITWLIYFKFYRLDGDV